MLNWRGRAEAPLRGAISRLPNAATWRPGNGDRYCYLLGLYLGDGCLVQSSRRSVRLVITLDRSYPELIEEAVQAMCAILPDISVRRNARRGCIALVATHPAWARAFPQHGIGKKHERRIRLQSWQKGLTHRHPKALLRGLIHSDGSRCVNRFQTKLPSGRIATYRYTRYFFTNYSADIRQIFNEHCDLLEIRWTQSSFKNISIADRKSVAKLDAFVGPKR